MVDITRLRRAIAASAVAALCVGAAAGSAIAATQGTTGATSTGTVTITATVPNLVRISGLNDLALGTWSGTGDMVGNDDACVWSSTGGYNITAAGSGAANAFTITDGTNTIAYGVEWDDISGQTTGTALTTGVALTGQTTTAVSTTCATNGMNTSVIVRIPAANLTAAPAGAYTGVLTLTVAPE